METIAHAVTDAVASITNSKILFILTPSADSHAIDAAYQVLTEAKYSITFSGTAPSSYSGSYQEAISNLQPTFQVQHASFEAVLVFPDASDPLNTAELLQKFIDADKLVACLGRAPVLQELHVPVTGSATAPAKALNSQVPVDETTAYLATKRVSAASHVHGAKETSDEDIVVDRELLTASQDQAEKVARLMIAELAQHACLSSGYKQQTS